MPTMNKNYGKKNSGPINNLSPVYTGRPASPTKPDVPGKVAGALIRPTQPGYIPARVPVSKLDVKNSGVV